MDGLALIPASERDLDRLADLIIREMTPIAEAHGPWDTARECRAVRRSLEPGTDRIIIHDGAECGVVSLRRTPGSLYLLYLVLTPAARGAGLGARVLEGVTRRAREDGTPAEVTVFTHSRAVRFYERGGFRRVMATDRRVRMRYDIDSDRN